MRVKIVTGGGLRFKCPGCGMSHMVNVSPTDRKPVWTWNGSTDFPTFEPSILVAWHSLSAEARDKNDAFRRENGRYMSEAELPWDVNNICHSFVRNGYIQFLSDCTHALAGQTVELPNMEVGS